MAKQELKFIWGWIHGHVVSGEFLPVNSPHVGSQGVRTSGLRLSRSQVQQVR